MMLRNWFMLVILGWMAGCSPFAPGDLAPPVAELPQHYALYDPQAPTPDRWWRVFADAQLDQLMDTALSGNFSIQEAWARLKQSRAVAAKSGALSYPDLFLEADAATYRAQIDSGAGRSGRRRSGASARRGGRGGRRPRPRPTSGGSGPRQQAPEARAGGWAGRSG